MRESLHNAYDLSDTHPGMRKLVHDPKIGKMATQLAGTDGMRIWHDQASD